jgi:hypothetical protein
MRGAGHKAWIEKRRDGYRAVIRTPEENRPFGRPWCR